MTLQERLRAALAKTTYWRPSREDIIDLLDRIDALEKVLRNIAGILNDATDPWAISTCYNAKAALAQPAAKEEPKA